VFFDPFLAAICAADVSFGVWFVPIITIIAITDLAPIL
jgi:hypothetical protein